jgi:hypothetical protein
MQTAKKMVLLGAGMVLVLIGLAGGANAQTVTPVPGATPIFVVSPVPSAAYIQFNDIMVVGVSGTASSGIIFAQSQSQGGTCTEYASAEDTVGSAVTCPMAPTPATTTMTNTSSTMTNTGTFTITINSGTQLLLSDRSSAVLGNITAADVINVYGYYDGLGNIDAQVVRDLSKPAAPGITPVLVPTTTTTVTTGTTVPATSIVGTNPTPAQLISILQTLMIQVQGVLSQLIQLSGTSVNQEPLIPYTGTTTTYATTTVSSSAIYN